VQQGLEVRRGIALEGDPLSRPRMSELEMSGMESNPGDTPLLCLRGMVFPVADDWMTERRKLNADLILQSSHQRNPNEGRAAKKAFDRIVKFRSRPFRVALPGQLLEHSLLAKVMNERSIFGLEMPAHDGKILPDRSMF